VRDYTAAAAAAPDGVPDEPIDLRQGRADMIELVRAASVVHRRGQWIEAIRNAGAVAMAMAGVIAAVAGAGRVTLGIVGAGWFLVSVLVLRGWAVKTAREGAVLQEMFDVALFYLPWRRTVSGDPIHEIDVLRLAKRMRAGSARDRRITDGWYDSTVGVHHPYDVLLSQLQNLQWDSRLRRAYSTIVAVLAVTWALIGALASVIAETTVTTALVAFVVPSLAAFQLAYEIYTGQRRIAAERERLANDVADILRVAQPGVLRKGERRALREQARNIQDGIFRTRVDVTRVPHWFYQLRRPGDEEDFAQALERERQRLSDPTP